MKTSAAIARLVIGAAALAATAMWPETCPRAAATDSAHSPRQIVEMWMSGPVRYIISAQEREEAGKLGSVPDLARFITEFWARRDPTPGTYSNEYRRAYWGRVFDANRRFRDSTVPGWKTDRGKIFVLLGEPDYVESDEAPGNTAGVERLKAGPGAAGNGVHGIMRWHYKRRLSKAAAPEFVVPFVRDDSLDWRLSSSAQLAELRSSGVSSDDSPAFVGVTPVTDLVARYGTPSPDNVFAARIQSNRSSFAPMDERFAVQAAVHQEARLATSGVDIPSSFDRPGQFSVLPALGDTAFPNYDLSVELSAASNPELLLATVTAREFLSGFIARSKLEFFRAEDGNTFVNLGALVPAHELYGDRRTGTSHLRLYASVTDGSDASQVRYATNEETPDRFDLARSAPPGGMVAAWTGIAVPPGRYIVTMAVEDSLTGLLGRLTQEVLVPDYRADTLALSTLVPASSISETAGSPRLGVTERASGVFRRSEDFGVYYEVYGLPKDDAVGFEASYTFFRETEEGPVQVGKPVVFANRTDGVQAWTFPLTRWPKARFTLEVTVSVPGRPPVTSKLPFEVMD